MSLIKFKNRNRLFPWNNESLNEFLSLDDFFTDDFFAEGSLLPAMNVKESENNFEIEFAAPGFSKQDFAISIDDNILYVIGKKEETKEEEEKKEEGYMRKEFNYNSFKRSLKLPKAVDTDNDANATYQNGILKLVLHKKEEVVKEQNKRIIEVN